MQEMQKGATYPSDPTLLPLSSQSLEAAQQQHPFKFAVPADDLLKFGGPRREDYVTACLKAMTAAVQRCDACIYEGFRSTNSHETRSTAKYMCIKLSKTSASS